MNDARGEWLEAVGLALTGERVVVPVTDEIADEAPAPDAEALVRGLAAAGWTAARLAEHRQARQAAGLAWPHPEAADGARALGAGQFHAVVNRVRELTGTSGLQRAQRVGPAVIGPAEARLLAERPPHHDNV